MADLRKGKVYITLNGEEFYGWDLCLFLEGYQNGSWLDKCVFFGEDEKNELACPKKHISNSVPKFGDSLYVAPNCSLALADIRRSYTLKRTLDTANWNVITPSKIWQFGIWCVIVNQVQADDKNHVLYCNAVNGIDIGFVMNQFDYQIDSNFRSVCDGDCYWLYAHEMQPYEQKLLDGGFKKPTICIDQLPLKKDNPLTLDSLQLVLSTASQVFDDNAKKNYMIQLQALNQCNWMDYKGTLSILFSQLLPLLPGRTVFSGCHASSYPKAVKEMVSSSSKLQPFCSQEDVDMACRLIEHQIEKKLPEFMRLNDLISLCDKRCGHRISLEAILQVYNPVVRLKPRRVENVQ